MNLVIEEVCHDCNGYPFGQIRGLEKLWVFACGTCNGSGKEYFSIKEYIIRKILKKE
jgi:DnaJ-class molecular chaperone